MAASPSRKGLQEMLEVFKTDVIIRLQFARPWRKYSRAANHQRIKILC